MYCDIKRIGIGQVSEGFQIRTSDEARGERHEMPKGRKEFYKDNKGFHCFAKCYIIPTAFDFL